MPQTASCTAISFLSSLWQAAAWGLEGWVPGVRRATSPPPPRAAAGRSPGTSSSSRQPYPTEDCSQQNTDRRGYDEAKPHFIGIAAVQVRGEGASKESEQSADTRAQRHGSKALHLTTPTPPGS